MIRAQEVRLIDAEGKQVGVVPIQEALKAADDKGLDLVEVSPNITPPVCKLIDFGKYRYQMRKKAHEAKKKQTVIHTKEIKLRTKTEEHDLNFKFKNMKKFLTHGDKVKVTIFFKGREIAHPEFGRDMLGRVFEELKDVAMIEQQPKLEGRNMTMLLGPITAKQKH